jgi:polyvinyl alcohol dehydrogenase (cytochrome)
MPILRSLLLVPVVALAALAVSHAHAQAPSLTTGDLQYPQGTNAGIFAFTAKCASCHDTATDKAPDRYALNRHTPEEVLAKITAGPHAAHAAGLTE